MTFLVLLFDFFLMVQDAAHDFEIAGYPTSHAYLLAYHCLLSNVFSRNLLF